MWAREIALVAKDKLQFAEIHFSLKNCFEIFLRLKINEPNQLHDKMPRLESKHLFQFPLKGVYDEDVTTFDAEMMKMMFASDEGAEKMTKMMEVVVKNDEESNKTYVDMMRDMMEGTIISTFDHPTLNTAMQEVEDVTMKIPTNHDGEFDVTVFRYTPKNLLDQKKPKAAYIYAHGGGVIGIAAASYKPLLSYYAVDCDVVLFNVDYRLAPETKCPNNIKDFYSVIKYVHDNAETLGIDKSKIAIGGESGGGYICLGSMVLLAQNDEGGLVKLAKPCIPMVDDYCFSDPLAMTVEEREWYASMRKNWNLIANDFEVQKNDPLLFPGKASDELLEKFPPTIMEECEFDMFITEATRITNRIRRAGRLLEFIVVPGAKHGSPMNPALKCFKTATDAKKLAFQHYLHN